MARKYLSLDRLTEYDALIKGKINEGDEGVKSYVDTEIAKMATSSHTHDDRYYTETEVDTKLSTINTSISDITSGTTAVKNAEHATSADSATTATKATQDGDGKVIADTYETKDDANTKLQEAKEYADTKVSGLASTSSVESAISTHNTSSDAHGDIRETLAAVKEDVDTFFKDATLSAEAKDTLKEIQDYITSDVSAAAEMLASINGKADKVHTHVISDVSGLQDALDTNNEAIEGLTETIENVKEDAANQAVIVLSEAQKGIDANTDRIEALETLVSNKVDTEHTHSWDDLEDKPFYEIISGDVLFEKQTVNCSEPYVNGYHLHMNDVGLTVTQGEEYTVVWDEVPYTLTSESGKLGNLYLLGAPNNTGEPFFIGIMGASIDIYAETQGEHTLEVYSNYNYEIKQLDSKFIPNIEWNELKNRPFYENISGNIILEEQKVNCSDEFRDAYMTNIDCRLSVSQGNEYTVIWDGVPYKVTAKTDSAGGKYLGNYYWRESSDNTGEPFYIGETVGSGLCVATGSQGEHTFEVYLDYNYELKQLDEKFIPDISIDKLPDISWNKISDKPFYESISGDVLLEEQAITLSEDNGNGRYFTNYTILSPLQLTAEEKYIVVWDGVSYETVYTSNKLGNLNAYHSQAPDSGEPFFIELNDLNLEICCPKEGEHTFAIYSSNYNCEVKKLDEKFIPDISWNNLKDKPFYEIISGDVLLEERTVNFSNPYNNAYIATINASLELTQGNEYTVLWDRVPYTLIFDTQNNSLGNPYLVGGPDSGEPFFISIGGNVTVFAETQGEHTFAIYSNYNCEVKQLDEKFIPNISWNNLTDRPFYENISGDVFLEEQTVNCSESNGNGYSTYINASLTVTKGNEYTVIWDGIPYKVTCPNNSNILGNNNIRYSGNEDTGEPFFIGFTSSSIDVFAEIQGEHTLAIYSDYSYEFKQLDEKFIPNISIDKLADISWNKISDKPFYESISGDILLEEQPVNLSSPSSYSNGYYTYINASLAVTQGNEYTVIWDGVLYTLTAGNNTLGNKYLYWGGSTPNTGEPFYIAFNNDGTLFVVAETQGEHTLAIYSNYNYELKQLDEKFIPDNIQRSTDNNLTTTDKTIVGAINELNNSGVGKSTTGTVYIIDDIEVTAFDGAEIFNDYSNNISSGFYSHAEGYNTTASSSYSHAEGALTKASGSYSHAEGHSTTASGAYSHAEGQYVKALSSYSHAEGRNTIASGENQHVQGKFNIEDTENKYAHIVGNGKTNKSRSNAHTLDWDGNAWYAGDVQATDTEGNTVSLVEVTEKVNDIDLTKDWNENDETSSKFIKNRTHYTTDPAYLQEQINRKPDFYDIFLEDFGLYWANLNYKVDTNKIKPNLINGRGVKLTFNETVYEFTLQHEEVLSDTTTTIYLIGNKSLLNAKTSQSFEDTGEPFVFEINVYKDNIYSCGIYAKEVTENNVIFSIQEATDIQLDEKYISYKPGLKTVGNTYTINDVEVTAKKGAEIFNDYANNIATGDYSHAEGYWTTASGTEAHAEGHGTTASGYSSHAEGQATFATGSRSHAEGYWTIASGENQHVQGKYNINDVDTDGNPLNTYAHIVGNGDSDNARSNAHTLDWEGNAWYQGSVYVGGTSQYEGSKLLTESEVDAKLQDKANATHTHAISDITDLETTLANAASAISANTNSISANSTAISSLQTIVNDIQEISSEEIQALFNA